MNEHNFCFYPICSCASACAKALEESTAYHCDQEVCAWPYCKCEKRPEIPNDGWAKCEKKVAE